MSNREQAIEFTLIVTENGLSEPKVAKDYGIPLTTL
jgi:hypothetical protein